MRDKPSLESPVYDINGKLLGRTNNPATAMIMHTQSLNRLGRGDLFKRYRRPSEKGEPLFSLEAEEGTDE